MTDVHAGAFCPYRVLPICQESLSGPHVWGELVRLSDQSVRWIGYPGLRMEGPGLRDLLVPLLEQARQYGHTLLLPVTETTSPELMVLANEFADRLRLYVVAETVVDPGLVRRTARALGNSSRVALFVHDASALDFEQLGNELRFCRSSSWQDGVRAWLDEILVPALCGYPGCENGLFDTGGVTPWGAGISIACPQCEGADCQVPLRMIEQAAAASILLTRLGVQP